MKKEYTSQELRRLPGVTYDTLRTWAGRRNTEKNRKTGKTQPVLLSPLRKPGSTHCWIYAGDAVERIWWIRMLQMLGYKNEEIEKILNAPDQTLGKEIWDSLDGKINDLQWKNWFQIKALEFAKLIRLARKLPDFPRREGIDDIDLYLEVLPVDPKVGSSDYESGSRKLLKAYGKDKDTVIAQANTPELSDLRSKIYCYLEKLKFRQVPADSPQVFSLMDTLYTEYFEKRGEDLDSFHRFGVFCAEEHNLDRSYGNRFSIFVAEAIFIYCSIQSTLIKEKEQSTDNS